MVEKVFKKTIMTESQEIAVEAINEYAQVQFERLKTNTESKELIVETDRDSKSDLIFITIKSRTIANSMLCLTDKHYQVCLGRNGGIRNASNVGETKDDRKYLTKCFRRARRGQYHLHLSL